MTDENDSGAYRRRARWPLIMLCLLCFGAGAGLTLWSVTRTPFVHDRLVGPARVVRVPVRVAVPVAVPVGDAAAAPSTAALEQRVDALDARIDAVDQRASAAVGDAGRAEGLLVAVATRRALDGGMPLGYLEGMLRARFGQSHPAAVATILSAARQPVTLDVLRAGLDGASPALSGVGTGRAWWDTIRAELGALVIVQRRDAPPTAPAERLAHAKQLLADEHVDAALAEVARLPAHQVAATWIAAARRYVAARSALETIETAALLEPVAISPAGTGTPPAAASSSPGSRQPRSSSSASPGSG